MVIKVFILGRPGSGKSTVAQILEAVAEGSGWSTYHIYDYKHLHDMFQQEIKDNIPEEARSFRQKGPDACQGFDVCDFKVLDKVLKQMANEIRTEEERTNSEENKLLLIEFARKEYSRALDIFGYELLLGAHLLYVNLGLEDCIQRVQKRADVHRLRSEYDHFVSEGIMRGYYGRDDWADEQFAKYLNHLRSVNVTHEELDNSGTDQELKGRAGEFFYEITRMAPELVATH